MQGENLVQLDIECEEHTLVICEKEYSLIPKCVCSCKLFEVEIGDCPKSGNQSYEIRLNQEVVKTGNVYFG